MKNFSNKPVIFHIDFDSYFVSAVRVLKPFLNGKPVAIAYNQPNAISVSVSYELKALGVKTTDKVVDIKKKVPNVVVEEPRFDFFNTLSNKIFNYLGDKYSEKLLVASIDECYLEVSHLVSNEQQAKELAFKIQYQIMKLFKIPITIGISHSKFFAKMTTNISKPFGIGYTDENNYKEQFFNLPIKEYHGIGKASVIKLKKLGIEKIGDLMNFSKDSLELKNIFGINIIKIFENLDPKITDTISNDFEEEKSIGKEITFEKYDKTNIIEIRKHLQNISLNIANRLKSKLLISNVIVLVVRLRDSNKWKSKQMKLDFYVDSDDKIFQIAWNLYTKNFEGTKIIGIGIRATGLISVFDLEENLNLFDKNSTLKKTNQSSNVSSLINQINRKLGNKKLMTAKELQLQNDSDSENNKFSHSGRIFRK